jgi:Ca2+ transporting ATPase
MGISGSSMSREAASIILLDDNFNGIVKSVLWGRNICCSIGNFLYFQVTVLSVVFIINILTALLIKQPVLTPIQLLW